MTRPKKHHTESTAEALRLLGPFNREGCRLLEEHAEREIWRLVECYRECKEELAKRPTPAQMRNAMGEYLKFARSWENATALPGGRHALLEVLREMSFHFHLELQLFPSRSKIRTEDTVEALQLLLDEFSRVAREQAASAAKGWTGKGWSGKSTPPSFQTEDPNFLLIKGCYALLGACGKPPKISRRGPLVNLARSVWTLANFSHERRAPHFRNQIDSLTRPETRKDPKNNLQHAVDFLIQSYPKRSSTA